MRGIVLFGAMLLSPPVGLSQTNVTTYHYDNARSGQNTQEIFLTPGDVNSNQFRRLFFQLVDGQVYAQPLYVSDMVMGPGTPQAGTMHNVVLVATEGDSVFAFDADNNKGPNASNLWKANLLDSAHGGAPGATTVPQDPSIGIWCSDISPQIGITSTPVIDSSGTLFVAAKTKEIVADSNGNNVTHYILRLHALDVTTGAERRRPASPIIIGDTTIQADGSFINTTSVSVPGTGDGSDGTTLRFNALRQNQRVGLLLHNGVVYVASGSHCDATPFHGWVIAYDANTLAQLAVFNTTPNGSDGGIWMEGAGLAADDNGNLFVATGNGTFDTTPDAQGFPGHRNFGDSILKLDAHLNVLDYFTPFNQKCMSGIPDLNNCPPNPQNGDFDLGSGGVLLLPDVGGAHPNLLTEAGKMGTIYVVDRDQMTTGNQHYCSACASDTNIVQELPNGVNCTAVPVYWNATVYFRGDCDVLKAFAIRNSQLSTPPLQSADSYSGKMVISAKGNANGIVWTVNTNPPSPNGPEVLNAYDAVNPSLPILYSSNMNLNRDNPGNAFSWTSPVAANGRVYVGAADRVSVFGLYGIGGYDLESSVDRSFAFDYDRSGKADHLAFYRAGTGTMWILRNSAGNFTPVYQQGDPGSGIGGYDLKSPADRAFAFDYDGSGKLDHMVLYRPGTGTIWILKNSAGRFAPVYQGSSGIGGYDLKSTADRVFAFDYDGSGKLDHLVLCRPGTGQVWILRNDAGNFTPVYQSSSGIGGYDLKSTADEAIALDYDGSGKLDHLVLYRPGTGQVWILRNDAGNFTPVYQGSSGIGGYDLKSTADEAIALDYDGSGKLDHLVLYRPGTGTVWILRNDAGNFTPVYQEGDPGRGIGGYDLRSSADLALAFDFDGSGRFDHLVLFRPGTSKICILQDNFGTFAPVYEAWEHTP